MAKNCFVAEVTFKTLDLRKVSQVSHHLQILPTSPIFSCYPNVSKCESNVHWQSERPNDVLVKIQVHIISETRNLRGEGRCNTNNSMQTVYQSERLNLFDCCNMEKSDLMRHMIPWLCLTQRAISYAVQKLSKCCVSRTTLLNVFTIYPKIVHIPTTAKY